MSASSFAAITRLFAVGIALALATGLAALVCLAIAWRNPDRALRRFYTYGADPAREAVTEEMEDDPLLLASPRIVPLGIQLVPRRDFPKRAAAIEFLGDVGARDALPVLRATLGDPTEPAADRAVALNAIARIDLSEAKALAALYVNISDRTDPLGIAARGIASGDTTLLFHRSYLEAFFSRLETEFPLENVL